VPASEPVVIEVGRYTAPRLRAGAVGCLVAGAALLTLAIASGGILLVLGALMGAALLAGGVFLTVAANASRGTRLVVDARGVTWDARAATWHAAWDDLSSVGVTVLRSGPRGGGTEPGRDRVVRLLLAFRRDDPDRDSAPLRRLRTADEPAPFTHRMPFASRGDGAVRLEEGLRRFAGARFSGVTVEGARGRSDSASEG
jgi:hypothetical protein